MAGRPLPVPVEEDKILSIADLEQAGSKKLPTSARGKWPAFSLFCVLPGGGLCGSDLSERALSCRPVLKTTSSEGRNY